MSVTTRAKRPRISSTSSRAGMDTDHSSHLLLLRKRFPAACRGGFCALKSDGSVQVFAGTSTGLYRLNNTDLSWIPVARTTTVTITAASPGVITETAHGAVANDPKVFSNSGGALPAAITAGTVYYVKTVLTANTYTISATPGGAAINTATTGTGTHSVTHVYSALSSNANWQFAQFGNLVFATQANEPLQVYNLSSSSAFSNNAGSPPQAAYISVVGRFLVLSGLLSNPFRVQWSGLNDTTNWTSGVRSSDFQDFTDGGIVRGVAGGEFGDRVSGSSDPAHVLYSRLCSDLPDRANYAGSWVFCAAISVVRSGSTMSFYSSQGFLLNRRGRASQNK
jgi:hypothetical protein